MAYPPLLPWKDRNQKRDKAYSRIVPFAPVAMRRSKGIQIMRDPMRTTLVAALLVPMIGVAALAQERGREGHWRDGDIHHFVDHDLGRWHAGHWFHGPYNGRLGWWWIVGDSWFFYPAPVYPYPDPYVPPVVTVPAAPASASVWYYCSNPAGYYPYVPECAVPWQPVPANASAPAAR